MDVFMENLAAPRKRCSDSVEKYSLLAVFGRFLRDNSLLAG
jgi:hypothetical protein